LSIQYVTAHRDEVDEDVEQVAIKEAKASSEIGGGDA